MRVKALLALIGLVFGLMLVMGCSDDNNRTVSGTVLDQTTGLPPAGGATVELLRNGEVVKTTTINTTTGRFSFQNVGEGTGYTLRITSPTGAFTQETVIVPSTGNIPSTPIIVNETNVSNGTVTVTVQDSGGNAIQGAQVQLIDASNNPVGLPGTTDINGQVTFNDIPVDTGYTVQVSATGFATKTSSAFDVTANQTSSVTVNLSAAGTNTINGTINTVQETGTYNIALYNANGTLLTPGALVDTETVVDNTPGNVDLNSFSFTNVPNGTYWIVIDNGENLTVAGPYVVDGDVNVDVFPRTNAQLANDEVTGLTPGANQVTVVAYDGTGLTINGQTDTGNPAFLTGVTPGVTTVTLANNATQVNVSIDLPGGKIIVFRPVYP